MDSNELKEKIWYDYNHGTNTKEISEKYGVNRSYVYQVISVKKGKGNNKEKILLDRITVLERQLADKTEEIMRLEADIRRKNAIIDKLLEVK